MVAKALVAELELQTIYTNKIMTTSLASPAPSVE